MQSSRCRSIDESRPPLLLAPTGHLHRQQGEWNASLRLTLSRDDGSDGGTHPALPVAAPSLQERIVAFKLIFDIWQLYNLTINTQYGWTPLQSG